MNVIRFLLTWLLLAGCTAPDKPTTLPRNVFTDQHNPALKNVNGTWMMKGLPYNGYILEKDSGRLVSKLPVVAGKEQGMAFGWYKTGQKRYERGFLNGNREGIHRGWYQNGRLSFRYVFHDDKYEGEQCTFYESGHRWQTLNYVHGYEEGKQKMWNDSGRVINNFTVKHGKLYGVIGRYDCMSVIKK